MVCLLVTLCLWVYMIGVWLILLCVYWFLVFRLGSLCFAFWFVGWVLLLWRFGVVDWCCLCIGLGDFIIWLLFFCLFYFFLNLGKLVVWFVVKLLLGICGYVCCWFVLCLRLWIADVGLLCEFVMFCFYDCFYVEMFGFPVWICLLWIY